MLRSLYIGVVRVARRPAQSFGLLGLMDRHTHHRTVHWLRSLFAIYDVEDLVHLSTPWWTYRAADEVDRRLASLDRPVRAFEWGAGASTLWLAARVDELHSIEHHADFAAVVSTLAPPNVSLQVIEPRPAAGAVRAPSTRPGYRTSDFGDYVDAIDQVGGSFDVIVIDGRARAACFGAALGHLADDGFIVFDNTSREEYRKALRSAPVGIEDYRGLTPAAPFPTTTSLVTLSPVVDVP